MQKRRNILTLLLTLLFVTAGAVVPIYQKVAADGGDGIPDNAVMVTSVCAGTTIPAGWAIVNITSESGRCGVTTQTIPAIWNVWYIENLNPYANGTFFTVCTSQPNGQYPAGWVVKERLSYSGVCGVFTQSIPAIYNVTVLERLTGGPTPTPNTPTPVPNRTPIGAFDFIQDGTALGWALDPDTPTTNVTLHVYLDGPAGTGTIISSTGKTYFPRPDVNTATGFAGNHGFSFAVPRQYYDGQNHTLYIYAIDTRTGAALLAGSPKTFNLNSGSPLGKFESIGGDHIARGWSLDPSNAGASNTVHFYIDGVAGQGTYIGSAYAGGVRPDVNQQTGYSGNHGFEFTIPSQYYNSQNHVLYAYGLDLNGNPNVILADSPKVFNFSPVVTSRTAYDFNADGKADQTVFRSGVWHHNISPFNTYTAGSFGFATDTLVPADYDGDGKTDTAIFRNVNGVGVWWILRSSDNQAFSTSFGFATDKPVPADYDGDGKADLAIVRNDNNVNVWWIQNSSNNQAYSVPFGAGSDIPVPADYDGDGKTDLAVNRLSGGQILWLIQRTRDGYQGVGFGLDTDVAVPADYDGDGKADIAIFRNGDWYMLRSRDGYGVISFGLAGDIPVPSDYDGDGKIDPSIFRNTNNTGVWWTLRSTNNQATALTFGLGTDIPVNGRRP